jgi:hypothetical protein
MLNLNAHACEQTLCWGCRTNVHQGFPYEAYLGCGASPFILTHAASDLLCRTTGDRWEPEVRPGPSRRQRLGWTREHSGLKVGPSLKSRRPGQDREAEVDVGSKAR